ncbi:MAG: hypothetical protein KHX91_08470 [Clostridium sp.]|nr:hypothetical protein [Clostridium sp.]
MKQGTTPTKRVKLDIDNSLIESVFFTVKSGKQLIIKYYPGEVVYEDGLYFLTFTQKETENLQYFCLLEAQVNLLDGSVAKSNIERFTVACTLYTNIQGAHTGGVDKEISLISSDVIIVEDTSGPIYASDVIGLDEMIPNPMTAQELRRIIEG